jgi:DNA-binding transcriptional ArsR family regulator
MNRQNEPVDRAAAAEYATWFKALADASRIQIVSLLAEHRGTAQPRLRQPAGSRRPAAG